MPEKENKLLYQILYFACIGVPYLNNYELTFAVWSVTILLTLRKQYSITLIKYVACFAAILAIAYVVSRFHYRYSYAVFRDFTYLVKPIVGLVAGYQLCRFSSQKALKVMIYTGLLIAIIHLVIIMVAFLEYRSVSVNLLRAKGGFFSDYEIYVLVLLIFYKRFQIDIPRLHVQIMLLIIGFSSLLYLARTNLIQIVILCLAMYGYFRLTTRTLKLWTLLIVGVLTAYSAVLIYNPKRMGRGIEAFLYKIKIAPIEPFKTRINENDWKDFHDNYRSYENIITVEQVSKYGASSVLFGQGLGATLDLGREVRSNDGEMVRYIPIVHNGYMTVFLKSGLLGVVFLLLFIVLLFRQRKSDIEQIRQINLLLIGSAVFLIVSNWVFLGLYLKLDNKSIIIGYLLYLKLVIRRENELISASQNAIDGKN